MQNLGGAIRGGRVEETFLGRVEAPEDGVHLRIGEGRADLGLLGLEERGDEALLLGLHALFASVPAAAPYLGAKLFPQKVGAVLVDEVEGYP